MSVFHVKPPTAGGPASGAGRCVAFTTLGCKVNAFETNLISEALQGERWVPVDARARADLYVINTCTVTREADRQARQAVRRAIRRNPDALVVVTGCYAQMDPDACAAIPGVDFVLGNDRKLDLHELLPRLERGELPRVMVGDLDQHVSLPSALLGGFDGRTRAWVQVQQGCDQECMFCVIHRARGPSRSLPLTLVRRQVQRLVMNGYREIVICGVDLGSWGADIGDGALRLTSLLEELEALPGDFRVRLSSIDPAHLDDGLIDLMGRSRRLCPHLHLSLQSGNSLILKRMKRRYGAGLVRSRIAMLRERVPALVLSADVMVGFPTETEAQFADTLVMVSELPIAFPHVFCYSERDGTPAARIPPRKQVPWPERRRRSRLVREAGETAHAALMAARVGTRGRVLVEGGGDPPAGFVHARSDDYLLVHVPLADAPLGAWVNVEYVAVAGSTLIARSLSDPVH